MFDGVYIYDHTAKDWIQIPAVQTFGKSFEPEKDPGWDTPEGWPNYANRSRFQAEILKFGHAKGVALDSVINAPIIDDGEELLILSKGRQPMLRFLHDLADETDFMAGVPGGMWDTVQANPPPYMNVFLWWGISFGDGQSGSVKTSSIDQFTQLYSLDTVKVGRRSPGFLVDCDACRLNVFGLAIEDSRENYYVFETKKRFDSMRSGGDY